MSRIWNQVLPEGGVRSIHDTSMRLLTEAGIEFPYEPALAAFRRHGMHVTGTRVHLTEDQVMTSLRTVPPQFTIAARNAKRSVTIGGGQPVFAPGYGAPFLVDLESGKRSPTLSDYQCLVKLAHDLPNQDLSGFLLVEPGDIPPRTAHLRMLLAHILHSDKPFLGSAAGRAGAQHTMEMLSILFGSEAGGRPMTMALVNSLSPLSYSTEMLEALVEYAANSQPLVIAALAMAGSTGPVTLAGVLAMQNAELLAGIVLTQLVSPGTPVIYGSTSTNIDMRSGALAIGSPELSQMIVAHAQMARFYGLPSRSGGALTDASSPDAQAGFESMLGLVTAVSSGIDFILHAGGILSSYLAFSYEKLVLDDEMCGMVRRLRRGIDVTPGTLDYETIARVGPGGNYLMEPQTIKRCRSEFWQPALCDRAGLEAWMAGGQESVATRARKRWQRLIAEHEDPTLDAITLRQLQAYVETNS